ncbi:MAG: hypothetical protein GY834_03905 [Bacteroidetes bacterium]|nr:hypothetical protein [Bacteroidota bacterium]
MNLFFLSAAILLVIIGLIHSFVGEQKLITPLSRQTSNTVFEEDSLNRPVLRVAWHLTTIAWWGLAIVIFDLANLSRPPQLTVHAMAGTFILTGFSIGVFTRGKHPAWIVFGIISILLWVGL